MKHLFEQALGLSPEARAGFIESVRLENEEMGEELAKMLANDVNKTLSPSANGSDAAGSSVHETVAMGPFFSSTLTLSTIADRFRILRRVGQGGMGDVFEAEDLELHERVALKTIRSEIASNPEAAQRFKREILLGKHIAHPNVCRIHDLGSARTGSGAQMLFLTMEFLPGETLESRIKRGRIPEAEAVSLAANIADGLAAAHEAGVIHRDFKSANVMLVPAGNSTRAVITDFGLARAIEETEDRAPVTKPGAVAGTVEYMAPEQLDGQPVTPAADIYSFGVVLFEMVTGRLPFTGNSRLNVAWQHLNRKPPSPRSLAPEVHPVWDAVILRCLAKDPRERFASATEVKQTLMNGSAAVSKRSWFTTPRIAAFAGIVLLLAATLISARFLTNRRDSLQSSPQRVAVLEFENIGGAAADRIFCEGLMEVLSSQLTELEPFQQSLSVIPASDIRRDKVTSARDAQRDFGATLAITGSVQRFPTGLRLTINVVDARRLQQLRSRTIFLPQGDAASMQEGIAKQIADLLDVQLRPEIRRRISQVETPVPGAYDFYVQGSGYLANGSRYADDAIIEFQHALERDPQYALAHAGLGRAYWLKYGTTKDRSWVNRAWAECRRSVELGPQLSEPHVALALLDSGTGRYGDAIREARLAIRIDPRNDRAYAQLASALEGTRDLAAAEQTLKEAISLSPNYWYNYARLGIFYQRYRRYHDAEGPFRRVIELAPDNPAGYTDLASIYHLEGRDGEAEQLLKTSIQIRPTPLAWANLAVIYFFEHRYADAVPVMEQVVQDRNANYIDWGNLGDAYRWTPGLGRKAADAYGKAIKLAEDKLAVNPEDAATLTNMAVYLAKLNEKTRAVQIIRKALSLSPDDKNTLYAAAMVYELTAQRQEALRLIAKARAAGYSSNEIASEPELNRLRQDPRFLKEAHQ